MSNRCAVSTVSIGDRFKPAMIGAEEINRKASAFLREHGNVPRNKEARKRALWEKIRAGQIAPEIAARVEADNRALFAGFDAEAAKRN